MIIENYRSLHVIKRITCDGVITDDYRLLKTIIENYS